jgi:uncharacterized protein
MKTKQRHRKDGQPDPKILAEIVQRVVEAAQPDKIILFGSAARGEMGPNSDIDLLVIKSGRFNHDRVTRNIYRNLSGAAAVDALVVTPEDLEQYGDSPYLVYYPALREGKVIYDTGQEVGHRLSEGSVAFPSLARRVNQRNVLTGVIWGVNAIHQPIHVNGSTGPGAICHWLKPRTRAWSSKTFATRHSKPPRKRSKPFLSIAARSSHTLMTWSNCFTCWNKTVSRFPDTSRIRRT